MKLPDNHIDREWAEERVERYVDGELRGRELKRFEASLEDPGIRSSVAMARRVKEGLVSLVQPQCPEPVIRTVLGRVRAVDGSKSAMDFLSGRFAPWSWLGRPLAGSLVTAGIVVAVALGLRQNTAPADDVDEALRGVKVALGYVDLAGRETGVALRRQVMDARLIYPLRRALDQTAAELDGGAPAEGESNTNRQTGIDNE